MATYGTIGFTRPSNAIGLAVGSNYQAIVNAAPAGSTFWFDAGTHRGVSIQPKDGDTFLGAPGAILNGSQQVSSFTKSGNAWVISNQTQQGQRNLTDHTAPGAQRGGYPETVFFDQAPLAPVDALSKLAAGKFYFDYAADKIYLGSDPTGHKVETGQTAAAFAGTASNVTIKGLTIEKYDSPAQLGAIEASEGSGWTVQNDEIRLNYGVGVDLGTNGKMIGNYVHDNGEMGLAGGGANIVVQGNDIAGNGAWSGVEMSWEGGGFKFSDTSNLLIQNNYSHDNAGNGMWTDINNYKTTYDNNLVANNALAGISHEISYDAVIKDNTVIGNGSKSISGGTAGNPVWLWGGQIQLHNSQNDDVYGNYVDSSGAGNGISLIEENRGSGDRGQYLVRNDRVHDNTIVNRSGNGGSGGESNIDDAAYKAGGNSWSNNNFFTNDGNFDWGGGATSTFAQFEAADRGTDHLHATSTAPTTPNLGQWMPTAGSAFSPSSPSSPPVVGTNPTSPAGPSGSKTPMVGTSKSDSLTGTRGATIQGNGGDDWINGRAGNETIDGGTGNDTIAGGPGDVLKGGTGHDTFQFASGFGHATIQDFEVNTPDHGHDTLVFSRDLFTSYKDVMAHATTMGQNTTISAGLNQLTLTNTLASELHPDHIRFA